MTEKSLPNRPGSDIENPPTLRQIVRSMRTQRKHDPQALRLTVHRWFLEGEPDNELLLSLDELTARAEERASSRLPGENEYLNQDVTIQVVPTSLRVVYPPAAAEWEWENPYYEVEGWLLGDYPKKTWIRIALRTSGDDEGGTTYEATIYRLRPGEQHGTERTIGIH